MYLCFFRDNEIDSAQKPRMIGRFFSFSNMSKPSFDFRLQQVKITIKRLEAYERRSKKKTIRIPRF